MYAINLSDTITTENVKYMGEMMAITALKSFMKHAAGAIFDRLYKGLLKDINRSNDAQYVFSDGYDFAQTASCFLCEHFGKTLNDVLGKDRRGKTVTVKRVCLRTVGRYINQRLTYSYRAVCIDDLPLSVPAIEPEQDRADEDYSAVDKIIRRMALTCEQRAALMCRMDGHSYPEAARLLSSSTTTVWDRIMKVRKIYVSMFSEPKWRSVSTQI